MDLETSLVDLLTPAQAAEKLNVNVTTLRKYSLLVEKVAANDGFFARRNNKRRNYTHKNIEDFQKMIELSQRDDMTLELAAESLFDGQIPDKEIAEEVIEGMTGAEKKLNEKISKQSKEINHLRKQLKDIQQENYALIRALKNSQEAPLFDYDMNVNEEMLPEQPTPAATQAKKEADDKYAQTLARARQAREEKMAQSNSNVVEKAVEPVKAESVQQDAEDKYAQALARARQAREERNQKTVVDDSNITEKPQQPRTLSNMQLDNGKKKWWQR